MTRFDPDRRTVLLAGITGVTGALAGCLGGEDWSDATEDDVDDYLDDVDNFDGIEDHTGEEGVQVLNGSVDGAGQQYVFEPAAIRIDAGTEVVWEWVGGTGHSVTHEEDAFDSGLESGSGYTWSHTFDESGTYLYYCDPHRGLEQKGAVVVE